jgi:hypothetical protein
MQNVGDTKIFLQSGTTSRYVWRWLWDDTVDATTEGTISRKLNLGGNPLDGFLVRHETVVVDDLGLSTVYPGSFVVNNPPQIIPAPSISANDGVFPYATKLSLTAFDFEGHPFTATLLDAGTFVSSSAGVSAGNVAGTYAGAVYTGDYAALRFDFDLTVQENKDLTVVVVDSQSGTSMVDFVLRGRPAQAPSASSGQAVDNALGELSGSLRQRIGPSEYAQFVAYSQADGHAHNFLWEYAGTNGWAVPGASYGTSTPQADGSTKNVDLHSIASETPGQKTVLMTLTDLATGLFVQSEFGIELVANAGPIGVTTAVSATQEDSSWVASSGDTIVWTAQASDPDGDLLIFRWDFTNPVLGPFYGAKAILDTTGLSPLPFTVQGILTVTDRLGATASVAITPVSVEA